MGVNPRVADLILGQNDVRVTPGVDCGVLPCLKRASRRGGDGFMSGYYHQEDLPKFGEIGKNAPELWKKFSEWYGAVFAEGALTEREKCLIALGVAHAIQCPYCIDAYTQASLEKGSNLEQMTEAIHVASAIRGGASLIHGLQMRNAEQKVSM
jgi:alkylhydroperoxidase/carboxymuconolactone decarboxylase family protein